MSFRLHLKNFQSIREATLDIAPLTFLAGPNSAGKSAIADALASLSLHFGKNISGVDGRRISSFSRDKAEPMTFGIGCDFRESRCDYEFTYVWMPFYNEHKQALIEDGYDLGLMDSWDFIKSGDALFRYTPNSGIDLEIYLNGLAAIRCVAIEYGDHGKICFNLENPALSELYKQLNLERLIGNEISAADVRRDGAWVIVDARAELGAGNGAFGVKIYSYNEGVTAFVVIEYLVNTLLSAISSRSGAFNYGSYGVVGELPHLGPLRVIPSDEPWWVRHRDGGDQSVRPARHADWHDGQRAWSVIANSIGEQQRMKVCEALGVPINTAPYDGDKNAFRIDPGAIALVEKLNAAMTGESLRLGYKLVGHVEAVIPISDGTLPIPPERLAAADYLVFLRVEDEQGKRHLLSDVGVGISQLVPVLLAVMARDFCIIEQPELHLHPKLQLELASFFIEQMRDDSCFVLETHSENIFLRVLRAIRETSQSDILHRRFNLRPEQVSVLYFDRQGDATEVKRLRISPEGEFIDRWPGGFFAEREAELF